MNKIFVQEPKINIAKITPHSTEDRFSSQLPVFFFFVFGWRTCGFLVTAELAVFLVGCEMVGFDRVVFLVGFLWLNVDYVGRTWLDVSLRYFA